MEKPKEMESFDSVLLGEEKTSIHGSFVKLVKKYTEELYGGSYVRHNQSLEKRILAEKNQLSVLN